MRNDYGSDYSSSSLDSMISELQQENGRIMAQVHELEGELRELRSENYRIRQENERLQTSVIRARYEEFEEAGHYDDEDR